ncbi:MAG: heme exporter protein CcmD [Rhodospirillaceae bacterium]|jgi:heme exporter protein CcmD
MENSSNFFAMGGYGEFIWPAFVISAIALIGVAVQSYRFLNQTEQELNETGGHRNDTENETEA